MAWPSTNSGDYVSGDYVKETGKDLFQRVIEAQSAGWHWHFDEVTEAGSSYVSKVSRDFWLPPWAKTGATVEVSFMLKRTGGTTAYGRAVVASTNGTEQSATGTAYGRVTSVVTLASDLGDTVQTFEVELKGDGTSSAQAIVDELAMNVKVVPA
jgi:hypothetical protein